MKLENDNGKYVCVYCGQVDRYDTVNEFVDFYDATQDNPKVPLSSKASRSKHTL